MDRYLFYDILLGIFFMNVMALLHIGKARNTQDVKLLFKMAMVGGVLFGALIWYKSDAPHFQKPQSEYLFFVR